MKIADFTLITMMIWLCLMELIFAVRSSSESGNELKSDDFNWFTEEHSIISPEQMRLSPTSSQERKSQQQRQQHRIDLSITNLSDEKLNKHLQLARFTGVGSLLNKKRPRSYSTSKRAIELREQRQKILENPERAESYNNARRAKENARRKAWTPEQREAHRARARKSSKARREWFRLPGNEIEREAQLAKERQNRSKYVKKSDKKKGKQP